MVFYYKIIVFKILLIVYQEISSYHISNTYCLKRYKNYSNIFKTINKYKFTWYYLFLIILSDLRSISHDLIISFWYSYFVNNNVYYYQLIPQSLDIILIISIGNMIMKIDTKNFKNSSFFNLNFCWINLLKTRQILLTIRQNPITHFIIFLYIKHYFNWQQKIVLLKREKIFDLNFFSFRYL